MKDMWRVKKGFTLVELSLSIAFISILSITVALITNDAISTYRRGLTLNQINTTGMDLVDDIRAVVQSSPSKAVVGECLDNYSGSGNSVERDACEEDGARKFVVFSRLATIEEKTDRNDRIEIENTPVYGAFCTGAYSFIWNSGYFYSGEYNIIDDRGMVSSATLKYEGGYMSNFRLLKVKDKQRAVCKTAIDLGSNTNKYAEPSGGIGNEIDISGYGGLGEEPEILLADDANNPLTLYDLSVAAPASNTLGNSLFYSISFILGTVQGGINVMSSGNFCKAPTEYNSNFDYCAINKFNFAAQATGG